MSNSFDFYQDACNRTAVYPEDVGLMYCMLGLAGEAGEMCNKLKKVYRDDNGELSPEVAVELLDELGDCLWYAAQIATELGGSLGHVAASNLDKLASRARRGTLRGSGDKR